MKTRDSVLIALCAVVAAFTWFARPSFNSAADATFVQPDRQKLLQLARSKELLQEGHYADAVSGLGQILASPEDGALPREPGEPDNQPIRFLKAETLRLIGTMPKEGREAYQREFGVPAQQKLAAALKSGNLAEIELVAGQFFHTQAGYQATQVLGHYHLDHGRALAAALCFQRLRDLPQVAEPFEPMLSFKTAACWFWSGYPEKADEVLQALRKATPNARFQVGGKQVALSAAGDSTIDWLKATVGLQPTSRLGDMEQWTLFRGNESRNAPSTGSRPLLSRRWYVASSMDPRIRDTLQELSNTYLDQNLTTLPALHPLVVFDGARDVVLSRTTQNLLAVDFATGKRIWEVPIHDLMGSLVNADPANAPTLNKAQLVSSLDERLWEDNTYGTLSSDGEYVYSIEDLDTGLTNAANTRPAMIVQINGQRRVTPAGRVPYNRLAAYELKSEGKLKWALGGATGALEEQLPEAGTFFLGPPLPIGGLLYVLAESNGRIRLLAIDPRKDPQNGHELVVWSQPLADLERDILQNQIRRLAGVSPSHADGVLVCPTAAGSIVGVDLTNRSLRWGYSYNDLASSALNQRAPNAFLRLNLAQAGTVGKGLDRWADSTTTIVGGRVLLTPADSEELHCVNLVDGKLLWKKPRQDGLYLACVSNDTVLIVGREHARAYRLSDGTPAWKNEAISLPTGGLPSGRGYFSAGRYFLPLTSAEVATIDVASGELGRSLSQHERVPGNLVCYKGAVISQTVEGIERFEQVDVLKQRVAARLQSNPDDAEALVEQAELLLDDGKLTEAVEQLRRSLQIKPDVHTSELLVDSLLEGLRRDFSTNRGWASEVEKLIETPAQQVAYLRTLGEGLQKSGEVLPAFQTYLKLVDINLNKESLERVERTLAVRQDRWVQARLSKLRGEIRPEEHAAMDEAMRQRLDAASKGDDLVPLRQFVRYFGGDPIGDEARLQLAQRLTRPEDRLEVELLLRNVERSRSTQRSREAVARLAAMLDEAKRPEQAAVYYRRLTDELGDLVCLNGKTGRQLIEELPTAATVREHLKKESPWPVGGVKSEPTTNQSTSNRMIPFDMSGGWQPVYDDQILEWDYSRQSIVARDGLGKQSWSVTLTNNNGVRSSFPFYNPGYNRARVHGNLVVAALGFEVFAINAHAGTGAAKVLWTRNLMDAIPGIATNVNYGYSIRMLPWGGRVITSSNPNGDPAAALGPVTDSYICVQRVRNLMALDPLSGETLWMRQNVPPGSTLFGDDEVIVVAPRDDSEAYLFRASDGEALGRRKLPTADQRMGTVGRNVVRVVIEQGKLGIVLYDPLKDKEVWPRRDFSSGSKAFMWRQEVVAVLETSGRIVLINLADGKTLLDSPIEPETPNCEVYLIGSKEHWIVVANSEGQSSSKLSNINPIAFAYNNPNFPKVQGRLYGFDRRTGEKLWMTPVQQQALPLDQPSELPVVVFVCQVAEITGNTRRTTGATLIIDKRTGKELHKKSSTSTFTNFVVQGDVEKKTVDLKLSRDSIKMTFGVEAPAEAQPAASSTPDAKSDR